MLALLVNSGWRVTIYNTPLLFSSGLEKFGDLTTRLPTLFTHSLLVQPFLRSRHSSISRLSGLSGLVSAWHMCKALFLNGRRTSSQMSPWWRSICLFFDRCLTSLGFILSTSWPWPKWSLDHSRSCNYKNKKLQLLLIHVKVNQWK